MTAPCDSPGDWDPLGGNLIFLLSPPRSGSTMLQLMMESHSGVHGLPEPRILIQLKYLGYYDAPSKAGYDTVNMALGFREFVEALPDGESAYLQACREYANTLYRQAMTHADGARYFVDKTPPYVLEWQFITKLYPAAKYVVLVRHPMAIVHSMADYSFMGNYEQMAREHPILPDYVPAIAQFVRDAEVAKIVVRYEDIVSDPQQHAGVLMDFLGLPMEPGVVEYGSKKHKKGSLGDPVRAHASSRPDDASVARWVQALAKGGANRRAAERLIDRLSPGDLAAWGYPKDEIFAPLADSASHAAAPSRAGGRMLGYRLKRRVFFLLRRLARTRLFAALLQRIRYYCDVILRH